MNFKIEKMKQKTKIFSAILFFVISVASFVYADTEYVTMVPQSFSELSENVMPCVVNISTVKIIKGGGPVSKHYFFNSPFNENDPMKDLFEKFFGEEQQKEHKQTSLGTGFMIDSEGYIITNNHVIKNADEIKVKLRNNKEFEAEIVGHDIETDIALIKIKSKEKFSAVPMGDSEALKVGEWVVAIGNPFGLEHTVTAGIVSAKGRVIGSGPYDDYIQTDASINFGNSGGPLINMKGEVIGINTAIIAGSKGIGFAIPINIAKDVVAQLKEYGEYTRGWLGVGIQDINEDIAEYRELKNTKGVLVTQVFPDDPADKAGIKTNDIIIEVNGEAVETARELSALIAKTNVDSYADITVMRDGKKKNVKVKIAKRDREKIAGSSDQKFESDKFGIAVTDITPDIAEKLGISDKQGVIVTDVDPDEKGAEAGLQKGDIIKEINRERIESITQYKDLIRKIEKGETVKLYIKRANSGYMVIKITS